MSHDRGDATNCSKEHFTDPIINQTIPASSTISTNCSKFQTNFRKILKLEQISENKWKECEKVKTGKIAADVNENNSESGIVQWYLNFMLKI